MNTDQIFITDEVRIAIEQYALDAAAQECCGLLGGKDNLITTTYALRNAAEKPETRYFALPEDLFAAMRCIRETGEEMLGIYHSHPRTVAYPSQTDVELAFYPEAIYFIISLADEIELRAFKIKGSEIQEVAISIVKNV